MYDRPVSRSVGRRPDGPLLVLSPHFDDAVLSCWGLLERNEPVDVITVFSGSPDPPRQGNWERRTGFPDSAASMAARREEDRMAFAGTPHRLAGLGLFEYEHSPQPRPASDMHTIRAAVSGWCAKTDGGTLALPAGAGRRVGGMRLRFEHHLGIEGGIAPNPDHLVVRDAALGALTGTRAVAVILYEELPYRLDGPADRQVAAVAERLGSQAEDFTLEVDVVRKAKRIGAYASQISSLHSRLKLECPESLPPDERYWLLGL